MGINSRGHPDAAIFRLGAPGTIVVQVFIADNVRRDVTRRLRVIITAIAAVTPIIEVITVARVVDIRIELIGSGEGAALTRSHGVGLASSGCFALAVAHDHIRGGSVFASLKPVTAGPQDGKCLVGCIHLKNLVAIEPPHADIDCSFREFDLSGAVVQVEEGKASAAVQANRRRTDIQLCARSLVGPNSVSGGHRTVGKRLHPIRFTRWLERNRALNVAQSRDAFRRIVIIRAGYLRDS